jgi:hypothetical protein
MGESRRLYSRQHHYESAREAYEQALRVEPEREVRADNSRGCDEIGDTAARGVVPSRIRRTSG